ncbi:MAG: transketolase [Gemmatimonadales bacterium]
MPSTPASDSKDLAWKSINSIRVLAMDAVQQANSGHPGTPMALAPAAYLLWHRLLRHSPHHPEWPDRDRFVLSCGHASMLLYGLLHLSGYDLPLEEIRRFRQWGSATPGHPERGHTPGVEVTTGPLGQGVGNAVGMAMAERVLAERFNRPGFPVVDHRVWAFVSDGDLMEGVASEAASLAGHLRLGKLNLIYDNNHITIDGDTALAFSEDVGGRFRAYGWHVQELDGYGNDLTAIQDALEAAATDDRPSLVVLRTIIADPAPTKRNTAGAHGAPLGAEEVHATKEILGWPLDEPFFVPPEAREDMGQAVDRGVAWYGQWTDMLAQYRKQHPELAATFDRWLSGELPDGWDRDLPDYQPTDSKLATRQASGGALKVLHRSLGNLIGGSADLAGSTGVLLADEMSFSAEAPGLQIHWGIREHGMAACLNGIAAHGGLRPYGSTFLIFTDYMKPSMRLAALMRLPVIYIGSHDSIGLGEDGPTHQPIEQLAMLRAIPNLTVIRPADANETVEAWKVAVKSRTTPTVLALTRQKLPILDRARYGPAAGLHRGAYVLFEPETEPEAIVMASGSEVYLALAAGEQLTGEGTPTRVVSFPSWELFDAQPEAYRESVLPTRIKARVSIEAAATMGWHRFTTDHGSTIGLNRFGASAPGDTVYAELDLTTARVVAEVRHVLARR